MTTRWAWRMWSAMPVSCCSKRECWLEPLARTWSVQPSPAMPVVPMATSRPMTLGVWLWGWGPAAVVAAGAWSRSNRAVTGNASSLGTRGTQPSSRPGRRRTGTGSSRRCCACRGLRGRQQRAVRRGGRWRPPGARGWPRGRRGSGSRPCSVGGRGRALGPLSGLVDAGVGRRLTAVEADELVRPPGPEVLRDAVLGGAPGHGALPGLYRRWHRPPGPVPAGRSGPGAGDEDGAHADRCDSAAERGLVPAHDTPPARCAGIGRSGHSVGITADGSYLSFALTGSRRYAWKRTASSRYQPICRSCSSSTVTSRRELKRFVRSASTQSGRCRYGVWAMTPIRYAARADIRASYSAP